MTETIQLGDVSIAVTRKAVKNVHLSVHPPLGHVTLVAPSETRLEVVRAPALHLPERGSKEIYPALPLGFFWLVLALYWYETLYRSL